MDSLSLMDSQCFVKIIEVNTKGIKEARLQSVLDETLTPENLTTEKFTVNDQDLEMIDVNRFYTVLDPKLSENGYCLVPNSSKLTNFDSKPLYVPVNLSYQPIMSMGTLPIPESLIHEFSKSDQEEVDWIQLILHQNDISNQFDSETERDSANFSCDSIPNDDTDSTNHLSSSSSIISTISMKKIDASLSPPEKFHCKCCQLRQENLNERAFSNNGKSNRVALLRLENRGLDLGRMSKFWEKMTRTYNDGGLARKSGNRYGKLRLNLLKNRPSDNFVEINSSPRTLMKMAQQIEEDNDDDFDNEYFKNRIRSNEKRMGDLSNLDVLNQNIDNLRTGNEEIRSEIKNIRNGFQEGNRRVTKLIEEARILCKDLKDLKYLDDLILLLEGQIDNVKMKPWPFKIGSLPETHPDRIGNLIV